MYIIYGKYKNDKFRAMDLTTGKTVNKLIYASAFDETEEIKEKLDRAIKELGDLNPEWKFEIRKK